MGPCVRAVWWGDAYAAPPPPLHHVHADSKDEVDHRALLSAFPLSLGMLLVHEHHACSWQHAEHLLLL